MALVMKTARMWLFQGWYGGFVHVNRSKYPTYIQAIARAREKTRSHKY